MKYLENILSSFVNKVINLNYIFDRIDIYFGNNIVCNVVWLFKIVF